jgi:tetratricopeptide (TPR) repeat protein
VLLLQSPSRHKPPRPRHAQGVFGWFRAWRTRRELLRAVSSVSSSVLLASADEHELVRLGDLCERSDRIDHATIAYARAAQLYEAKEQRQKVVAMRRRIVQLLPFDPEARIDLSRSLDMIGRRREAAAELEAAAALTETTSPKKAAELLRMALELDPSRLSARTRFRELDRALSPPAPELEVLLIEEPVELPAEAYGDEAPTTEYSPEQLQLLEQCREI